MKLAAVIDRIPNFGGVSYEENVQKFFQTWVEETKKLDLAKVKDGLKGEDVEPQYMVTRLHNSSMRTNIYIYGYTMTMIYIYIIYFYCIYSHR